MAANSSDPGGRWRQRLGASRPDRSVTAIIVLSLAVVLARVSAQTAAVRVFASNGVKAAIEALQPQAARAIGGRLSVQFDTSASLKQRIDAGEAFDVAIVTTDLLDELVRSRRIAPGTRTALARSGIGVGIRRGAVRPDIRTADALKRTLLAARTVTYARDGASRPHILAMFDRLGIAGEMQAKTMLEQGSIRSTARVANGEAELVLTLVSEILPIAGIELAGPLPPEFQHYVDLAAGVSATAADAASARALVAFLAGPDAAPTLAAKGMEKP